jgi:hypothetical protein
MTVARLQSLRGIAWVLLVPLATGGFILGRVTGDAEYRQTSVDWTVLTVSDDNRRLTIAYETGDPSCHADKVDVVEGSLYVRIRVLVRAEVGGDCGNERMTRTTEVRLHAPFADLWDSRDNSVFGANGRVGGVGRGT